MKRIRIRAVEMVRRIRDAHYLELRDKTPQQRIAFYRKKAQELHDELGRSEELAGLPSPP